MDVRETLRRHVDALNRRAHVSGHLGSLAVQAARSPGTDILVHAWQQEPGCQQTAGAPNTRVRKGVKCIKGLAVEEYATAGEESLDDLFARVSGQCRRCGTRRLCGGECLDGEVRRHVGRGETRKLRRTRESGGGVVNSRNVSNILSELRDVRRMLLLSGGPRSRKPAQGVAESLVVFEDEKLAAFQHQAKVAWRSRQPTTPC